MAPGDLIKNPAISTQIVHSVKLVSFIVLWKELIMISNLIAPSRYSTAFCTCSPVGMKAVELSVYSSLRLAVLSIG